MFKYNITFFTHLLMTSAREAIKIQNFKLSKKLEHMF